MGTLQGLGKRSKHRRALPYEPTGVNALCLIRDKVGATPTNRGHGPLPEMMEDGSRNVETGSSRVEG